jgi:hypothetical protein
MSFTSTQLGFDVEGIFKVKYYSWTATGVSTGSITHGLKEVKQVVLTNKTGLRVAQSIDTSVAGTVTIAGVTASDTGYIMVVGK